MADTFFTSSPHWGGYIVLYFFAGGIAGGCAVLAGLLHWFGGAVDRPAVRNGYLLAFTGALLSGLLLTLDLTQPLRFWHMLIDLNTGSPVLKPWSPMSLGAWGLLGFGGIAALGALGALGESRPGWRRFAGLSAGIPGKLVAALAIPAGLFLAGYTGVLLAVSNRPIWADSTWLGAVFLCSGVSNAIAALILLGRRTGQAPVTESWLCSFDRRVLLTELLTLSVFLWSLGSVARAFVSGWGLLFLGAVGAGILIPLELERRGSRRTPRAPVLAAILVLLGGVLLRVVMLAASSAVQVQASRSAGP